MERFKTALSLRSALAVVLSVFAVSAVAGETMVELVLERSTTPGNWEKFPITGDTLSEGGKIRLPVDADVGFFRLGFELPTGESTPMGFAGSALDEEPAAILSLVLERSTNLLDWENVSITDEMLGEGGTIRLPVDGNVGYFRLSRKIPTEGFALIPAGSFEMGDHMNEPEGLMERSRPVHEVYVSEFIIAETPVTYEQWREVYDWAVANGYDFDNEGQRGSDANEDGLSDTPENNRHPVVGINWYDTLKWCNAWSEMQGFTPAYYTDHSKTIVFKTGQHEVTNEQVRWDAEGFRLPTEAEWEKAARGDWKENAGHGARNRPTRQWGISGTMME